MQGYSGDTSEPIRPTTSIRDNALRTRVVSAIFIGFITIVTALLGDPWFSGLIVVVIGIATVEMIGLMRASGFQPSLVFGLAATALLFVAARFPTLPGLQVLFTLLLMIPLAWQMRHRDGMPIADWAIALAGGAYLGWTGGHLASLRQLEMGLWWLVIAIGITWLADSGAYFVGRRFGRHKLAPTLSPHKTWEGYFGGIAAAILGGLALGTIAPMGILHSALAAALVGAFGTLGDLAESMFKRQASVKDSGHLIPGHGGAFDRIDSLLWAGVIVFYYATLIYR
ncbi:MAG: phosphatidate cytidylyltransferase [Chloroflexi bacterium]|nr:phosphatidate cytidylyltransferase [Chloroflexota bacterium]